MRANMEWLEHGAVLSGQRFGDFQRQLTKYNHCRLEGGFPTSDWRNDVRLQSQVLLAEGQFLEAVRQAIRP